MWDESRLAINAVEMLQDGFSIVPTFEGKPDMWNTKPPLMIWLQVLSMKIFGVNELAIRFPSAIAGFLTCLVLLLFSKIISGRYRMGFIASVILVSSAGFTRFHVTRTGDYDALLILFTTIYTLSFFSWVEKGFDQRFWWSFCVALILSVFVKSISGLLFFPALLVWVLYLKMGLRIAKLRYVWIGIILIIFSISLYYLFREQINPGYLKAVWTNELGTRYLEAIEGNGHGFWFYWEYIIENRSFHPWWIFLTIGIIAYRYYGQENIKRWMAFCLLLSFELFLVISIGKTKLDWYFAPIMPLIALVASFSLLALTDILRKTDVFSAGFNKNWLPMAFVLLILAPPYFNTIKQVYDPVYYDWEKGYYSMSAYFRHALKNEEDLNGYTAVVEGYVPHIKFYEYVMLEKGQKVKFVNKQELEPGDKAIADQLEVKTYIESNYNYQIKDQYGTTNTYYITGKR